MGPEVKQLADDPAVPCATASFIGTAHALRRKVFIELGGYREFFVHQGEEGDYCMRMLNAGYFTKLGSAPPIHHFESPLRDTTRMNFYSRRNDILFPWCNVPIRFLGVYWIMTTLNGLRHGIRIRKLFVTVKGLLSGYIATFGHWKDRRPVSIETYLTFRQLRNSAMPIKKLKNKS